MHLYISGSRSDLQHARSDSWGFKGVLLYRVLVFSSDVLQICMVYLLVSQS